MRAGQKTTRDWLIGIAAGGAAVAVVTVAIELFDDFVPVLSLGVLYVFAVLPIAIFWGPLLAVPVAIASMLAFNFFFLPPVYTFTLADRSNWFALAVYVVTAVVVGSPRVALPAATRRGRAAGARGRAARRHRRRAAPREPARGGARADRAAGGGGARRVVRADRARPEHARAPRTSRRIRSPSRGAPIGVLFVPEREEPPLAHAAPSPAGARLAARVAIERETLAREALEAETLRRSDTVKTAVIQAVSHDLRTPLATIEQALDGLESGELALTDDDRERAARDDPRRAPRG